MERIAVFFGGKSVEHDISIITGLQAMQNLNEEKYQVVPVYITREGKWLTGEKLKEKTEYKDFNEKGLKKCFCMPNESSIYIKSFMGASGLPVDAALVCMHGINGEDGTLQGLLALSNIPFTSAGVLGCSASMDKIVQKCVYVSQKLQTLPFIWFYSSKIKTDAEEIAGEIEENLGYPVMVKPSNLGSSIGISVCTNKEELLTGLEIAAKYDNRILIEQALTRFREINISCIGHAGEFDCSVPEELTGFKNILSFNDKYIKSKDTKVERTIPAKLNKKTENKLQAMAKKACASLDCSGVARVDFLIDEESGKVYINEINAIPGSLSMHLWREGGITAGELLDKLITIAKEKNKMIASLVYAYSSQALFDFSNSSKLKK